MATDSLHLPLFVHAIICVKIFKYKKAPKYSEEQKYLWNRQHVSILPIGIREDGEIVGKHIDDKGWTHERL